jgi:hypothetical protein
MNRVRRPRTHHHREGQSMTVTDIETPDIETVMKRIVAEHEQVPRINAKWLAEKTCAELLPNGASPIERQALRLVARYLLERMFG